MTGIVVEGSRCFQHQVESALKLLEQLAPGYHQVVTNYLGIIREWPTSGVRPYDRPPVFLLSRWSAFCSVTWCAGVIVHDAWHSKLYHEHLLTKGPPVPDHVWAGVDSELRCFAAQEDAARAIGSNRSEVEYIQTQNGLHTLTVDRYW